MTQEESKLHLHRGIIWQEAPGKGLLYDRYRGTYLKLNSVGLLLVHALAEPTGQSLQDLAQLVSARYGIPLDQAQGDVGGFLDELRGNDVLELLS